MQLLFHYRWKLKVKCYV